MTETIIQKMIRRLQATVKRPDDLPLSIKSIEWDVIIVDAPCGHSSKCPGRYGSIYTSKTLSGPKTHIFVDDFDRKVEHDFSTKVFGSKPIGVVERPWRKHAFANTQVHFYGFPN